MATKRYIKKLNTKSAGKSNGKLELGIAKEMMAMAAEVKNLMIEVEKAVEIEDNKVVEPVEGKEGEVLTKKEEVKKPPRAKKAPVSKAATTVADVGEEKLVVEKKRGAKKETVKKEVAKKPEIEKKPTRRSAIKTSLYIQFDGNEVESNSIMDQVKKIWTLMGNKVSTIKSIDIYVKPEENTTYYVINDDVSGKFDFSH